MDPDQTAPIGAVCSGSTLFASVLNSSVMLGNYLQQATSADDIFRCIFFLGTLRVNPNELSGDADQNMIWVFTVCLCPLKRMQALYGLKKSEISDYEYICSVNYVTMIL